MKKVIKWLDNFWYHNKWTVILVTFFSVAIIIMITQFVSRDSYDSVILYTGPDIPTANEVRDIEDAFENIIPYDYDGDGKKRVSVNSLFLLTDDQLKDKKYTVDENGNPIYINTSEMMTTRQQFTTQIFVGEALICLLDPNWYEVAASEGAFVPLSELTDNIPENTYDDCAVYLRDTGFGGYFTAMNALPEDTLICFRKLSSASALKDEKKEEKRYEFAREFFTKIIDFSVK